MANDELTETSLRTGRLMAATFPTVGFIVNISSLAVLWIGADRIATGQMQIGSLVAYISYLIQILIAVVMATFMASMVPRAAVAADRIVEVLETDSSVRPPEHPGHRGAPSTARSSSATWRSGTPAPNSPCSASISFRVAAGETTAIIGSTGAGKTTLVNLVARLFDATEGTVLVDGVDVRELDPDLLWGRIGYVPQQAFLFSGTVASNLRFGRPDATDAELWEALEIAQASGFVQAMPDGLESPIAQGGTNVSGGQRQRLSIARALVARPEIFVFDDSFSALDLATDARLRAALEPVTRTPRCWSSPSACRRSATPIRSWCSRTAGSSAAARHDELVVTCPTYAEIVASQLGEGAVA